MPAAHEFAVRHLLRRVALGADDTIFGDELIDRCAEARRPKLQQCLACRRARLREVGVIEIRRVRLRAGGRPLIGRQRRVALNERDRLNGTDSSSATSCVWAV